MKFFDYVSYIVYFCIFGRRIIVMRATCYTSKYNTPIIFNAWITDQFHLLTLVKHMIGLTRISNRGRCIQSFWPNLLQKCK